MNKNISLPGLQRIAMEFEKENDIMEQRQEIMDDAMDDATGVDEEAEGDEIVDQVLEEIGVNLKQSVRFFVPRLRYHVLTSAIDGRNSPRIARHRSLRRESCTGDWWRGSW
jgi:hypothetical protein